MLLYRKINSMTEKLDIFCGKTGGNPFEFELANRLADASLAGTMFIGYPHVKANDPDFPSPALYLSQESGLLVFDFTLFEHSTISKEDIATESPYPICQLIAEELSKRDNFGPDKRSMLKPVVFFVHQSKNATLSNGDRVTTTENAPKCVHSCTGISKELYVWLHNFLRRIYSTPILKGSALDQKQYCSNPGVTPSRLESYNSVVTENIEFVESIVGPQTVTGLAGTGKTTLLAYKAAFLHYKYPDWRILFAFQTRSQHEPLKTMIESFFQGLAGRKPDWEKLSVFHAWGGLSLQGLYHDLCEKIDLKPAGLSPTRPSSHYEHAFREICDKLLVKKRNKKIEELYDAVLIDEAQDHPPSFFRVVYHATKHPRRITTALDPLQNFESLGADSIIQRISSAIRQHNGNELYELESRNLTVNYRNSSATINTALSVGLGSYRKQGSLRLIANPVQWIDSRLKPTHRDIMCRKTDQLPKTTSMVSDTSRAQTSIDEIEFRCFSNKKEERRWIASQISVRILENGYRPEDALVIVANPNDVHEELMKLSEAFFDQDFGLHAPGLISSQQSFSQENSIPVVEVNRVKGEESRLVYIVGADYFNSEPNLAPKRKMLHTAMTRSIDKVHVSGLGIAMQNLVDECRNAKADQFSLLYKPPLRSQIAEKKKIDRANWRSKAKESKILYDTISGNIAFEKVPSNLKEEITYYADKIG